MRGDRWVKGVALGLLFLAQSCFGLPIEDDAVFVRVIDTGAGLATVTRMPGGYYMIYDAGHWTRRAETMDAIKSVIPDGEDVDLLVLSHSDSDHLGVVEEIFQTYTVREVIRSGLERTTTNTWNRANNTIRAASQAGDTKVYNLKSDTINFGSTFFYGDVRLTFISGFYVPPDDWEIIGGKTGSEFRNAGSVVIRLSFNGKSILYTGDAVGRHIGDDDDALIASEKFMVDNADAIKIDSDVLIAPHHGADNASSTAFIQAVSPEWVVISAGNKFGHPRAVTAQRYLDTGIAVDHILRTDLGDDERGGSGGGDLEWAEGRIDGNRDPSHDDDIDILIRPSGEVIVDYR